MIEFTREFLLDVCKQLKPAAVEIPELPVFGAVCFERKSIYAYNDYQAVSVAADTGVKNRFGVSLKELDAFLKTAKSETIKLEQGPEAATFKAGRSRVKLSVIPSASFVFNLPSVARKSRCVSVGLGSGVLDALRYLITAVSLKSHDPAYTGVIFSRNVAYATNGECLARYRHKYPLVGEGTILLPGEFVRMTLSAVKGTDAEAFLKVFDGFAVVELEGTSIYTKLDSSIIHHDYGAVFGDHVEQLENEKESVFYALGLFDKMIQYAGRAETCLLTTKAGALKLAIDAPGVSVRDSIKTKQVLKSGVRIKAETLKPLSKLFKSEGFDHFVLADSFIAFYTMKGKLVYLVSAEAGKGEI